MRAYTEVFGRFEGTGLARRNQAFMRPGDPARARLERSSSSPTWSEQDVRQLLKAVRRPHVLRDTPLALAIARRDESVEPLEAVRQVVRDTFNEGGLVGRRLLELIERCDFDASLPMAAVASQLGVSPRQLFRLRREAVRALQRSAEYLGSNAEAKRGIARLAS